MCARKALKHEFGERDAFELEKHMNVARRDALSERDGAHRQYLVAQILKNNAFDRLQPCRTHSAAVSHCRAVPSCAE